MTLTDDQRLDAAMRLIKVVTGEPYGDGETVTDVGIGYAGGGSGYTSDVWVLGDWNDKTRYVDGKREITSTVPSRLFDALERIGVNGEWLDEWNRCQDCRKLIRTEENSYHWLPQYEIIDSDYMCVDCLKENLPFTLDGYVNEVTRAVTWLSADDLYQHGWEDAFPGEHDAQNGLHAGMNDKPADFVTRLRDSGDERDYLFVITDKSQFYMEFRLLVRSIDSEESE